MTRLKSGLYQMRMRVAGARYCGHGKTPQDAREALLRKLATVEAPVVAEVPNPDARTTRIAVTPRSSLTPMQRFMQRITRRKDGCWEWGGLLTKDGYGRFFMEGKYRLAHRVAYMLHVGEIGGGLYVCHKCDRPWCVNPDHLFLGTQSDNARDMVAKGRDKVSKAKRRGFSARQLSTLGQPAGQPWSQSGSKQEYGGEIGILQTEPDDAASS